MSFDDVVWHDVECGRYDADLPLWHELAAQADHGVLDVGAGTGRVALKLAEGLDAALADGEGPLFALPTYTALLELRELLARRGQAEEYWR